MYGKKHLNAVKKYEDELNLNEMAGKAARVWGTRRISSAKKYVFARVIHTYDRHVDFMRYIK